jgi:hypothetical protein
MKKNSFNLSLIIQHQNLKFFSLALFTLSLVSAGFFSFDEPVNTFYDAHTLANDYDYPSLTNVYGMPLYTTKVKEYDQLGLASSNLSTSIDVSEWVGTELAENSPEASYLNDTYPTAFVLSMEHTLAWEHAFNDSGLT